MEDLDKNNSISIGKRVVIEGGGQDRTIELVDVDDVDPAKGRISALSPIGESLLGKAIGQTISVELPGGRQMLYKIKSVEPLKIAV
ncbi:hypothetical protein CMO96_01380 [Candidatus Woesebacteria bacterium]|nr:hypothetical protein [Candidatus Woesebacteria bacterium]|tara:strand:+ start:431 stop:688 length:258 start_codon:yes stop_codon:yes gene_type:complete